MLTCGIARAQDFVNDTFAGRTAGTTLQSAVTGGSTGATWTPTIFPANLITSSTSPTVMRMAAASSNSVYTASGTPPSANYFVQADFTYRDTTGAGYLIGRAAGGASTTNYLMTTGYSGGQLYVGLSYNFTGAYFGTNYSFAYSLGATHTVRLTMNGTSISVQLDGSTVITTTDTHITAAGLAGVGLQSTATTPSDTIGLAVANFRAAPLVIGITPGSIAPAIVAPYANTLPIWNATLSKWQYNLSVGSAVGGNGSYTYQWTRGTTAGGESNLSNGSGIAGATTNALTDALSPATTYYWKISVNDTVPTGAVLSGEFSYTTPPTPTNLIVNEGDSTGAGYGQSTGKDLGTQLTQALGTAWASVNVAFSGDSIANINSTETTQVDSVYSASYTNKILLIWAGTNDIANNATAGYGTTTYNTYKTYVLARRAVGYKVFVVTIINRGTGFGGSQNLAGFQTEASAFNTLLRTNWATFADGLIDLAANKQLSYTYGTSASAGGYYINTDNIHPNNEGGAIIAGSSAQAITRFLTPGGITSTIGGKRRIQ